MVSLLVSTEEIPSAVLVITMIITVTNREGEQVLSTDSQHSPLAIGKWALHRHKLLCLDCLSPPTPTPVPHSNKRKCVLQAFLSDSATQSKKSYIYTLTWVEAHFQILLNKEHT